MFTKIGIFTCVSAATLGLTSFTAYAQTVQQGTQDASIQGNDNEVNQTINQYYFNNPGKGAIKRKELNNHQQSSTQNNTQPTNSNNREWGHNQGEQRRNSHN